MCQGRNFPAFWSSLLPKQARISLAKDFHAQGCAKLHEILKLCNFKNLSFYRQNLHLIRCGTATCSRGVQTFAPTRRSVLTRSPIQERCSTIFPQAVKHAEISANHKFWCMDLVNPDSLVVHYSPNSAPEPSAMDSNRVELFRNASLTVPVGPLRCLRMISSATPSSSGSSGL